MCILVQYRCDVLCRASMNMNNIQSVHYDLKPILESLVLLSHPIEYSSDPTVHPNSQMH